MPDQKQRGPGRALIAIYALFAVAATSRALVQLFTKYAEAPIAYLLSALAAVVYVVITVALVRDTMRARTVAAIGMALELAGVLIVGTLSLVDPTAFPRATVWSSYGRGYLFIPLVLPIVGLIVLRRQHKNMS